MRRLIKITMTEIGIGHLDVRACDRQSSARLGQLLEHHFGHSPERFKNADAARGGRRRLARPLPPPRTFCRSEGLNSLDIITAILLGIVEGLTEFLPVSSTGHLILATELLGYDAARWALFNIAIQPGAILAIVVLYRQTFIDVVKGLTRWEPQAVSFTRNLLVAFFPAVVLGLALGDYIDLLLENAIIVAWALIVGGVAILLVERFAKPVETGPSD